MKNQSNNGLINFSSFFNVLTFLPPFVQNESLVPSFYEVISCAIKIIAQIIFYS